MTEKATMDGGKKEAFTLEAVMQGTGRKNKTAACAVDVCFIWIYLAGITIWLYGLLQMQGQLVVYLAMACLAAAASQTVFTLLPVRRVFQLLIWSGMLLGTAVLTGPVWESGIHEFCNLVIAAVGRHFPYMLPAYGMDVSEKLQRVALYLAVCWLLCFLAFFADMFVKSRSRVMLGIQFFFLLAVQLLLGTENELWAFGIAVFALAAVWIREHGEKVSAGIQRLAFLETVLVLAVLSMVLMAGGGVLLGRFMPKDLTVGASAKTYLTQKVKQYRYEGKSKVLPDGDFTGLSSFKPEQTAVLKVTMSQPESCYLRGFTGAVYTDKGWTDTENQKLWENRDLFYWLHQDGFYGQEILGHAAAVLGDKKDTETVNTITVQNINGNSRYIYTPYELKSADKDTIRTAQNAQKIGDCALVGSGLKGQREYTYQAYPELITKYPSYTAALLDTEKLNDTQKAYQKEEEYYNAFAYANYLDIPERLQRELHSLLGEADIKDGEKHAAYAEAKQNILYLLTEGYTDTNELDTAWNGSDFIYEFLEISKKGYAIHFASAATMMFRYYGIPARYVEGYLITPRDRDSMTAGVPYVLDETHAHAWVEYYQDGAGWLPFETTPSYLNTMHKAEDYQDISGVSSGSSQDQQQKQDEEDQQDDQDQEDDTIDWTEVVIVLLLSGIAVMLLIMLAFFIWMLVQRHKSRVLKRRFTSPDLQVATEALFEYTMNICSAAGLKIRNTSLYRYEKQMERMFDRATAEEYRRIVDIRQQAVYSENRLTKEQKDEVAAFKDAIWKRIYSKGTFMQKLQLKFIYFL